MFLNNKIVNFQCEICEFAKHKYTSFSIVTYKLFKPFTPIHNDVWEPSRIPNCTHSK